jgi:DNA-binding NarL/FixJ family response regulator
MKNVAIIEDISETRQWLVGLVKEAFPDCFVKEARDVRQGVQLARGLGQDLALIDLGLPDGSGIDVVQAFKSHQPDALLVVATVMGDDASIMAALSAGAHGYLLKDSPSDLFVSQLAQLKHGFPALSPSIARRIMEHFASTNFQPEPTYDLTAREREVLSLVGRGLRNQEVATTLGLTTHTISGYIKSIYQKLGISTRAQAALKANRMGLA